MSVKPLAGILVAAASVIPVPVGATNGESSQPLKNVAERTTPAPHVARTIQPPNLVWRTMISPIPSSAGRRSRYLRRHS